MPTNPKLLIFGYGNPSRGDDALGPLLLEKLQAVENPNIEYLTDFQLQVEHALDLEGRDLVLFIDAHLTCQPPFEFAPLQAENDRSYTTHAMSPSSVLQVYQDIKHSPPPPSFMLSVRGEQFELGEGLSPSAQNNLNAALAFAKSLIAKPELTYWQWLCSVGGLQHTMVE